MSPLRRPTPTELGQVGEAEVVEEAGEVHARWRVGDVRDLANHTRSRIPMLCACHAWLGAPSLVAPNSPCTAPLPRRSYL